MGNATDYYAVLGVMPSADDAVIKAVYRALMKKWHPDTYPGDKALAEQKCKEINEAFSILSNPESRKQYDQTRAQSQSNTNSEYDSSDDESESEYESGLEHDWQLAIEYYPNIERMRNELRVFSNALAITFQVKLLEHKLFPNAAGVRDELIAQFLRSYFGSNVQIQKFAKWLIQNEEKAAARELNKLIRTTGSPTADAAKQIISRVSEKFGLKSAPQSTAKPSSSSQNPAAPQVPWLTTLGRALMYIVTFFGGMFAGTFIGMLLLRPDSEQGMMWVVLIQYAGGFAAAYFYGRRLKAQAKAKGLPPPREGSAILAAFIAIMILAVAAYWYLNKPQPTPTEPDSTVSTPAE